MVRKIAGRIRRMLEGGNRKTQGEPAVSHHSSVLGDTRLENSVERYYRHKVESNLEVFYRFALQTRSLMIRDSFAKASSTYGVDLESLLGLIQECKEGTLAEDTKRAFLSTISVPVLLTLADLLANTARHDLDTFRATSIYDFVSIYIGMSAFQESHKLQYVEALHDVGRYQESAKLAESFEINSFAPLQSDLLKVSSYRKTRPLSEWLGTLNELYTSVGLSPVTLSDDQSLPVLDRLTSAATLQLHGPKISVIMPTYAPGQGIFTAIRSLLEQTWQNLEIIVVDDASPSEYGETFEKVASLDPRITVLHHEENVGAYVARNTGLEIATGDFITTHDDDDWSHPDKLAKQVTVMVKDSDIVATTSGHIRTSENLHFRRVNMKAQYLQMNYSSLMFRREIATTIGPWDTVNRGGDSEFYTRMREYVGPEFIVGLHDVPLSFSRVWDGSLTSGEMSRGYFAYSRLLYRWSFRQWHWDTKKIGDNAIRRTGDERPYAVPTTFEAGKRKPNLGLFDVVYVTDFFRQAKCVNFVINEIETLIEMGLRVGYMHIMSPETNRAAGFPKRLFELQHDGQLAQIDQHDRAESQLLIVYDSAIGMYADQLATGLITKRSLVVDHSAPKIVGSASRKPTCHRQALENLDRAFSSSFTIAGTTEEHTRGLEKGLPTSRVAPAAFVWREHIRSAPGGVAAPDGKPVVGFHSFGNRYRWPGDAMKFRQIYGSPFVDTRLLGSFDSCLESLGSEVFEEITLFSANEMNIQSFLESIDFWVYSPHNKLDDQIWTPVLEAMQAGKVVVLPERLQHLYGNAAIYFRSDPYDEVIQDYSSNETKYVHQAQKGQAFVSKYFSVESYVRRINLLLASG